MNKIPPYKDRKKIENIAQQLTASDEPAVRAEDCGMTAEDIDNVLGDLERAIEEVS